MRYDEEDKGKDEKIYDLFKQAMQETKLLERIKWARIIIHQLEQKHLVQLPKDFLIKVEFDWLASLLTDHQLVRELELRYKVTDGVEGYKYFDRIENDNPNDIFNFRTDLEVKISKIELRILDLFSIIVKTLDVEIEGDDL
jgi:hypothetical protein